MIMKKEKVIFVLLSLCINMVSYAIESSVVPCFSNDSLNFSTGIDANGNLLPIHSPDPLWTGAFVADGYSFQPTWNLVNGANIICNNSTTNKDIGVFKYRRFFSLCESATVAMSGIFRADNRMLSFHLREDVSGTSLWSMPTSSQNPQCYTDYPFNATFNLTAGTYYFEFEYQNTDDVGGFSLQGLLTSSKPVISNYSNCICSCQIHNSMLLPKLIDLPVLTSNDIFNLTPTDGLRIGSMVYNCTTDDFLVYDKCNTWQKVLTEPKFSPAVDTAGLEITYTGSTNQGIYVKWNHPFAASVSQFVLQVSTNHSPWVDYQTFPNTVFQYSSPTTPTLHFNYNQIHQFRIKALNNCGVPTYSCNYDYFFDLIGAAAGGFPILTKISKPYTVGSGIEFTISQNTGGPTSGWFYRLEKFDGGSWQLITQSTNLNISSFPYLFVLPTSSLILDEKYRLVLVNNLIGGATSNNIEFYYSPPKVTCE